MTIQQPLEFGLSKEFDFSKPSTDAYHWLSLSTSATEIVAWCGVSFSGFGSARSAVEATALISNAAAMNTAFSFILCIRGFKANAHRRACYLLLELILDLRDSDHSTLLVVPTRFGAAHADCADDAVACLEGYATFEGDEIGICLDRGCEMRILCCPDRQIRRGYFELDGGIRLADCSIGVSGFGAVRNVDQYRSAFGVHDGYTQRILFACLRDSLRGLQRQLDRQGRRRRRRWRAWSRHGGGGLQIGPR